MTTPRESPPVLLIPSVHTSPAAPECIERVVESFDADGIAVELCEPRIQVYRGEARSAVDHWWATVEAYIQSGLLTRVEETDMAAGMRIAREQGLDLHLIDARMNAIYNRFWDEMGYYQRFRYMVTSIATAIYVQGRAIADEEGVHVFDRIMREFAHPRRRAVALSLLKAGFPTFYKWFVRVRNRAMAKRLERAAHEDRTVVAVIGALHTDGVRRHYDGPGPLRVADVPAILDDIRRSRRP